MDRLTVFPLKWSLVKDHCYHPRQGAKQIVNPLHSPDIKVIEERMIFKIRWKLQSTLLHDILTCLILNSTGKIPEK